MVDGYTFLSKEEVDAYYEQQAALEWAARGEE
jgi:guanylate kinase